MESESFRYNCIGLRADLLQLILIHMRKCGWRDRQVTKGVENGCFPKRELV